MECTLSFKRTGSGEIRTLIGLHIPLGVVKMPRVSIYWEAGMDIDIFRNTKPCKRVFQLRSNLHSVNNLELRLFGYVLGVLRERIFFRWS